MKFYCNVVRVTYLPRLTLIMPSVNLSKFCFKIKTKLVDTFSCCDRHERDVTAQLEAITALERFPTPPSRLALTDTIENDQTYVQVRCRAAHCLTKVTNAALRGRNMFFSSPRVKNNQLGSKTSAEHCFGFKIYLLILSKNSYG